MMSVWSGARSSKLTVSAVVAMKKWESGNMRARVSSGRASSSSSLVTSMTSTLVPSASNAEPVGVVEVATSSSSSIAPSPVAERTRVSRS